MLYEFCVTMFASIYHNRSCENEDFKTDCAKGKSISKDCSVMDQWYKLQKNKWCDEDCDVVNTMEIA